MKKYIIAAVAALGIAVPVLAPTAAQAYSRGFVTASVKRAWTGELRQMMGFRGIHVVGTTLQCASGGGGYYSCDGTYTVTKGGLHAKYSTAIQVSGANLRWNAAPAQFIREW